MKEFDVLCDCILVKNGHKCYKQYVGEKNPYLCILFTDCVSRETKIEIRFDTKSNSFLFGI